MHFTKMHGLGNDYLYVFGNVPDNIKELCAKLSDRHFGAGSDGMIYINECGTADFEMRIFNADGSEAMMCGNGIRCVGKYVYDKGYTDKTDLTVQTRSGIKNLKLDVSGGYVTGVEVNMGKVQIGETLHVNGHEIIRVSMGNPHAVIFTDNIEDIELEKQGRSIEDSFPGGINVEFVQLTGDNELRMRVWERGSGITLACGTGACASAAAAVSCGLCQYGTPITVELDGGILSVTVKKDGLISMYGPAQTVYEGEV